MLSFRDDNNRLKWNNTLNQNMKYAVQKMFNFSLTTAFAWQACKCSVAKNGFFKNTREQNIRGTRCPSGNFIYKRLPGSKNNRTSYFNTASQLSKHKLYIEVM